jgi:methylthioribose-1-phosphate isomerase
MLLVLLFGYHYIILLQGYYQNMQSIKPPFDITPNSAVTWYDNKLYLLDQRLLPNEESCILLEDAVQTAEAIHAMVVRGAPAIGVTAAYGVVLAARKAYAEAAEQWKGAIEDDLRQLEQARPTAVNLGWAVARMRRRIAELGDTDPELNLLDEARMIHEEDILACRRMGDYGASLMQQDVGIITHCNAGALATGGYGTALGVVRSAFAEGKLKQVFADETRPWLQGSRLTAWELARDNIPVTLLADGAAASRMAAGGVDWVVVGSDRIAANGDVANKIGTYHLILAAKHHGIKVMVAAPISTIDMNTPSGEDIPIEQRDTSELLGCNGQQVAAGGVPAWNPVFDVTPAALVDVIVTERGIIEHPDAEKIKNHMA